MRRHPIFQKHDIQGSKTQSMIETSILLAHVVELGVERFYEAVKEVEEKNGVIITIAIDTDSLWWCHGSPPHVVVSRGKNTARIYLLSSYGQMVATLNQVAGVTSQ